MTNFWSREQWEITNAKLFLYGMLIFTILVAASVNGLTGDLSVIIQAPYFWILIAVSVLSAPFIEEGVKLIAYRKLTYKSGVIFAIGFTMLEALIYSVQGIGYYLVYWGIGQIFGRFVYPFHVYNYFVMRRFGFGLKGYLLAVFFHAMNNLAVVLMIFYAFTNVANYTSLGFDVMMLAIGIIGLSYVYSNKGRKGIADSTLEKKVKC